MVCDISELDSKANVIGYCLGNRRRGGHEHDEQCCVVFVRHKMPKNQLDEDDLIDDRVRIHGDELPTDVQQAGDVRLLTRTRHRPAPGGVSVGLEGMGTGTMGSALLETEDGLPVVLTNSHVAGRVGADAYQPSPADGSNDRENIIGTVIDDSGIDLDDVNTTDSALIEIDASENPRETASDMIHEIGEMGTFREAEVGGGEYVKTGRTTGFTTGDIRGRGARLRINYSSGTATFEGCDVFDAMSAPGDSGSLIGVMDEETGTFHPTSLLFAGSSEITIGIPLDAVEDYHGELSVYEPTNPTNPTNPTTATNPTRMMVMMATMARRTAMAGSPANGPGFATTTAAFHERDLRPL